MTLRHSESIRCSTSCWRCSITPSAGSLSEVTATSNSRHARPFPEFPSIRCGLSHFLSQVPLVYGFNNWYPAEGGSANCGAGCIITEERITITPNLNVTFIIAFFGIISGTNHLIQFIGGLTKNLQGWFEGYTVTVIRNVDYAFSASLMLMTVGVLFLAPVDVQTMTYVFCFQFLTQLAGCSAEVIRQIELMNGLTKPNTTFGKPKFSLARPVFFSASAIYVLPWSLLFVLFYTSGYGDPAPESVKILSGLVDPTEGLEAATPPLQVVFFLAWLFVSFALFPVVLFLKINTGQGQYGDDLDALDVASWNFRYEVWFSVLSFISKVPLQAFFALGAFNRDRITSVGGTFDDNIAETQDEFNARVVASSIWPGVAAVFLGALTVWVFSDTLQIDGPLGFLKKIGWFSVAAVLLGFAVFFPVIVNSPSLEVSVGLNSMSSVLTVLVAALVQHTYLWLHSTPGADTKTDSMEMTSTALLRETSFI